jgi:membrane protein implicated in regulation of membrane protease activity
VNRVKEDADFLILFVGFAVLVMGAVLIYEIFVYGMLLFVAGMVVSIVGGYRFLSDDEDDENEQKKDKPPPCYDWQFSN